jgi:uncharacterized protein YyaL (SSP411 family)
VEITNRLAQETSPYLLQHADNPVHWLPWNEQSLQLAKQLDRPILLSVGYSACHWCHVMAHESFEDAQTAEVMNELFINIKVDKEERPDLDKIYQNAHSLLTQRAGGWPLTVFLTPDTHMPIFAGTYFPDKARQGLPAFRDLLKHIDQIWRERKFDIQQQSKALSDTYERIHQVSQPTDEGLDLHAHDIARNELEQQFDRQHGGFSKAPKFPHPAILDFALKQWRAGDRDGRDDNALLHCAMHTLEKMAEGGLFDHVGGGFCRYSTDEMWMIPHFEKMLYDNGPLLSLYSQACAIKDSPVFRNAIERTADWVIREMQSADGGYYSAQDADSEGEEGKFFTWSKQELDTLLASTATAHDIDADVIELFKKRYGLDRTANFEGNWHLHAYHTTAALAASSGRDQHSLNTDFDTILQQLFTAREPRIHPQTDTKVLVSWNALMIQGMAKAARISDNEAYTESALRAVSFIRQQCWNDGRLSAIYKDGRLQPLAYIDDYAFLLHALLEILQNSWDNDLYEWSLQLADSMIELFEDSEYGGFYFTAHDHEDLIQRIKPFSDDAIPAGNAIACLALTRLGRLSGSTRYLDTVEKGLSSAWTSIKHSPLSHSALLMALSEYLEPTDIIIIRQGQSDSAEWQDMLRRYCLDDALIYRIDADIEPPVTLADKIPAEHSPGCTVAYPCRGNQCFPALQSCTDLEQYLQNNSYRILE